MTLRWLAVVLVTFTFQLGGCTQFLAERIVYAPNGGQSLPAPKKDDRAAAVPPFLGVTQALRVPVGDASMAVWVLDPKTTPRGTILVLHGIFAEKFWLLRDAQLLRDAGYRAVLVDLRGHGDSGGKYITFGVRESQDLSAVLDDLAHRNLIAGNVGVYGISYGAATAIEFAGHDPRVKAVVAVAPFSDMRSEIPHYAHTMLPLFGWCLSDSACQQAITEAGHIAGFNPDDASPLKAIQQTTAPVLLVHGTWDMIIPVEQSEALHAAAPDHSQLLEVPMEGHTTAWLDADGKIARETATWFDRYLSPAAALAMGRIN